jgi:hypothetical protein
VPVQLWPTPQGMAGRVEKGSREVLRVNIYTTQEKIEAVQRELTLRRRVYPRFVENKTMSQDFCDRQIGIFEEIRDELEERAKGERLL